MYLFYRFVMPERYLVKSLDVCLQMRHIIVWQRPCSSWRCRVDSVGVLSVNQVGRRTINT